MNRAVRTDRGRTAAALRLALVALTASLAACRDNSESDAAVELLSDVKEQQYQSWARAPGYETRKPAASPHGDEVDIFVNDVVSAALGGPALAAWPDGSIIVKDGYAASGELEVVAVLAKEDGGWFWAEYDADGAPLYSGEPAVCTGCHASGGDFVRAFALPTGPAK